MRIERGAKGRTEPPLGALFGGVLLLGATLAAVWFRLGLPRPVCLLREWTGIPCPSCGSTRMLEALLSGKVVAAFLWNPLAFLVLAAVVTWAMLSAVRLTFGLTAWHVVLAPREKLALRILACALLAAGWAYLIWRGS